jgi:polar amino acid transport system substrate-binding protein
VSAFAALAPTGAIRVAVAVGPTVSAVWTCVPEGGTEPEGVTVDLARRIGEIAGLPVRLVKLSSSAEIVATADDGLWDVGFAPADAARRAVVAFGPAYHTGSSTYLVRADSSFLRTADLNRGGARVMGVAGTATLRSAEKAAPVATVTGAATLPEAIAAFAAGEADALALGRASLDALARRMTGVRVLEDDFHTAETAICVPRGNDAALAAATGLMQRMIEDGTAAASLKRHGVAG